MSGDRKLYRFTQIVFFLTQRHPSEIRFTVTVVNFTPVPSACRSETKIPAFHGELPCINSLCSFSTKNLTGHGGVPIAGSSFHYDRRGKQRTQSLFNRTQIYADSQPSTISRTYGPGRCLFYKNISHPAIIGDTFVL